MIMLLAVLASVAVGVYNQTAHRALNALFAAPTIGLANVRDGLRAKATALSTRIASTREENGGGTPVGALAVAIIFAFVAAVDIDVMAITVAPLLGFKMEVLEQLLHMDKGNFEKYSMPAVLCVTVVNVVFAGWLKAEVRTPRLLATGKMQLSDSREYRIAAWTSLALMLVIVVVGSTYRAETMMSEQGAAQTASAQAAPIDPVAAAMAPVQQAPAQSSDRRLEWAMFNSLFLGVGIACYLLLKPALMLGPIALCIEVGLLLLWLAATLARLSSALVGIAHGVLGWAFQIAHPVIEIIQKLVITLVRPFITWLRALHTGELARHSGARAWILALTSWTLDLEIGNDAVGTASLHNAVAQDGEPSSSQHQPPTAAPLAAALVELDEQEINSQHAWEAYPSNPTTTHSPTQEARP